MEYAVVSPLLSIVGIGISVGLAFIPATIAKNKGYSYGGFWALGFFFFLIGLIVALCLDPKPGSPKYAERAGFYPPPGAVPYGQAVPPYQAGYTYAPPQAAQPQAEQPEAAQPQEDYRCTQCSAPFKQGDAFCSQCGSRLQP